MGRSVAEQGHRICLDCLHSFTTPSSNHVIHGIHGPLERGTSEDQEGGVVRFNFEGVDSSNDAMP